MKNFDYILTGGGMAGLSLAYHMLNSPLKHKKVLIIDREPKTENDRTWCFWTKDNTLYDPILYRDWDKLDFHGPGFSKTFHLAPYRYKMLRGIDFYTHTQAALRQVENFPFLYGDVESITSHADGASVTVDGQHYQADWVFDSLFLPGEFHPQSEKYHYLWQHFKGWVIKSEAPVFTPDIPTMFDFRTPQDGAMRFIYILPFSPNEALVEITLFSGELLTDEAYDRAIKGYIQEHLGNTPYRVTEVEQGKIPMTDQPFPRFPAPFHMTIGTKGGRVKASTGYAFWRTQHDSRAIVDSLIKHGDPTRIPSDRKRARMFDSLMLEVMDKNGGRMADIFTAMFRKNRIQRIFRFLDEESSLLDELGIVTSVPPGPFLKALKQTGIRPGK